MWPFLCLHVLLDLAAYRLLYTNIRIYSGTPYTL